MNSAHHFKLLIFTESLNNRFVNGYGFLQNGRSNIINLADLYLVHNGFVFVIIESYYQE
jgi:hypothetical protein